MVPTFFSPTAECYGVFAQYWFGVFWASWGGSGKEPGSCSGNWFREPVLGTCSGWQFLVRGTSSGNRVQVSMGSDRFLRARGFEGFRGVRFCSQGFGGTVSDSYSVLRKYTLVLGKCTFVLWKYAFVSWKYTCCTLLVYFSTLKVCFCALRKYSFVPWKYAFALWNYIFVCLKV